MFSPDTGETFYTVKKNQRHTTNEKPNMYKDIYNNNQYFGQQTFFSVTFMVI